MNKKSKYVDKTFENLGFFVTYTCLFLLIVLFIVILIKGINRLNISFLTSLPSRFPEKAGILTPMFGTLWVLILTTIFAFPLGVAAGIYLEEYLKKGRLSNILEINISNLAGVPSIIYGLLGLEIFVRTFRFGPSILSGGLTLALLVLPIIIVATRESIRAVPNSIRDASYALGASKWQTIWYHVLPSALGGILTGVILAISRAVGEAAPLIIVGALAYVPFIPRTPLDQFSVLPIQIFNWISRPQKEFIVNAAAAIVILLLITFLLNSLAIYFRNKWQKRFKI